jgi:hypothetical protein
MSDQISFTESVQKYLPKDIFSEWARQIKTTPTDATAFANTFLELMRHPENHDERRAAAIFATLIKDRPWAETLEMLTASLDDQTQVIFSTDQAEVFYEQFKAMVLEQIREYWEQFMKKRGKPLPPSPKDWSPLDKMRKKKRRNDGDEGARK